jgi:hypothetical protein
MHSTMKETLNSDLGKVGTFEMFLNEINTEKGKIIGKNTLKSKNKNIVKGKSTGNLTENVFERMEIESIYGKPGKPRSDALTQRISPRHRRASTVGSNLKQSLTNRQRP